MLGVLRVLDAHEMLSLRKALAHLNHPEHSAGLKACTTPAANLKHLEHLPNPEHLEPLEHLANPENLAPAVA